MKATGKVPLVFVVSFAKAGTHLIGELMKAFGYEVLGPVLPPEIVHKLAHDPLSLPTNTCIMGHALPLAEVHPTLALHFHKTGMPAIVLNYRDPRDVLCSYVRFLMLDTRGKKFAPTPEHLIHAAILESLPDHDQRLLHAITDVTFPFHDVYRQSTWLRRHPEVCQVSFERLVGAAGGGCDRQQGEQVAAVMRHLGVGGDPESYASDIFRSDLMVFSRGQIGAWRQEFKPEHLRAFNRGNRDLLELYGYEVVEA